MHIFEIPNSKDIVLTMSENEAAYLISELVLFLKETNPPCGLPSFHNDITDGYINVGVYSSKSYQESLNGARDSLAQEEEMKRPIGCDSISLMVLELRHIRDELQSLDAYGKVLEATQSEETAVLEENATLRAELEAVRKKNVELQQGLDLMYQSYQNK